MSLYQLIKNNPLKILLGSSGTIITLVGALFTVDARYAHAADVEKINNQTQKQIVESANTLRKQMLEDKLFELDVKKSQSRDQRLPSLEQALQDRYQRQLNELIRRPNQ